ncbi:AAA family ATPase [Avibacterium sp. 21-595]|uniref:AAA family ATPase n=1 Tax=Avibacterium sp. 21-595 TaxID=2911527 RepID=UPI0020270003|nr:AAA family ATPase [Avibacterium sp. 21-595]URL06513.1 AAA family ATPase [Avibacterium sp. 21-595]
MLINQKIEFSGVKGIKHLILELSNKKMNVLIGSNGVGKTKALESLYTLLLLTNNTIQERYISNDAFVFQQCKINHNTIFNIQNYGTEVRYMLSEHIEKHDFPVIYLAAQNRGEIKHQENYGILPLGEYKERQTSYFEHILNAMSNSFSTLNMNNNIEEWFIQRAQSANDYQAEADNREVELLTVLRILNKIDPRISADKQDFKIIGGKTVSIMLDGQPRRLNELSSGFASLIKIVQSIVAGYGFFTNANDIENVQGYVLIDEIESHLHIKWQSKILPLLQQAFPKTYFIISTHSSLVLAQLHNGNAYQLVKNDDSVVTLPIQNPSQMALVDLLNDAFDLNLNQLKIDGTSSESQKEAKSALLSLLGGEE